MNKKIILCENCSGWGHIHIPPSMVTHGEMSEPEKQQCTICKGTGRLVRTTIDTPMPSKYGFDYLTVKESR
jgi:DnaJ-class molecular chaperone